MVVTLGLRIYWFYWDSLVCRGLQCTETDTKTRISILHSPSEIDIFLALTIGRYLPLMFFFCLYFYALKNIFYVNNLIVPFLFSPSFFFHGIFLVSCSPFYFLPEIGQRLMSPCYPPPRRKGYFLLHNDCTPCLKGQCHQIRMALKWGSLKGLS